jgi:hypothetical protein
MIMKGGFPAIAPYLKDPLVLIGFFLFLAFLFTRYLLKQRIIPPLPPGPGFRILKMILLYGFIIGLLLVVFGFAFKYRELVGKEHQESLDRELRRKSQAAAERQAEQDRVEREQQRLKAAAEKRQEEISTIRLLKQELASNLKSVNEMRKNTQTSLSAMLTVAQVLRHPGIKILPILFPKENLDPQFQEAPTLAAGAMDRLDESGLLHDQLELQKFTAVGRLLAGTVDKTIGTVESLTDREHQRYMISAQVWNQYLPALREITMVDVTKFQKCYADLASARTNYDIIQSRIVDYLESVRGFFRPTDNQITKEGLGKVLAAEHLAIQLSVVYGQQLVADISSIKALSNTLDTTTVDACSGRVGRGAVQARVEESIQPIRPPAWSCCNAASTSTLGSADKEHSSSAVWSPRHASRTSANRGSTSTTSGFGPPERMRYARSRGGKEARSVALVRAARSSA